MDLNEITKQKWKISKKHSIINFFMDYLPREEQECHMNISREEGVIFVDCTYQSYILKLAKSSYFTLLSTTVSSKKTNKFVLGINGTLELKGLTIKRMRRKISPEQKKALSDRARVNLTR